MTTNREAAVEDSLEMRLGHEVPVEDYGVLAASLNDAWSWFFEVTPEIIGQRFESGHPFLVAYGPKKPDEILEGVDLRAYDGGRKMPLVFLETVALRTGGDYSLVPRDYFSLTANGLWAPPPEDADTIIMVDLTSNPSRDNSIVAVGKLIKYAKEELFTGNNGHEFPFGMGQIEHIWTYSPDDRRVQIMHRRNGAKDTDYVLEGARIPIGVDIETYILKPELNNVRMMSYKG